MKNRLISDKRRKELTLLYGEPIEERRGSGRTTAIALSALGEAMRYPGIKVPLVDHHKASAANRHLAQAVAKIVNSLGLHFITVGHRRGHFVRYDVFEK